LRIDLQNKYIIGMGEDKSDKNVKRPSSERELAKYLGPRNVFKVIQKITDPAKGKTMKDAINLQNKEKQFLGTVKQDLLERAYNHSTLCGRPTLDLPNYRSRDGCPNGVITTY
jgi:hypothetical protein